MTDLRPTAAKVMRAYRAATDEQRTAGLEWYANAHAIAVSLDPDNPGRAAGVLAALSPRVPWLLNVELADRAYRAGRAAGTLGRSCAAANRILGGEAPLDVLTGPKVRAFYTLIADPGDGWAVCVDRHAVDVAIGQRLDDKDRGAWFRLERGGLYRVFADCYRTAGRRLGVLPAVVQATTWVSWRASLGVVG